MYLKVVGKGHSCRKRPWLIWRIYAAECTRQSAGVATFDSSSMRSRPRSSYIARRARVPGLPASPTPAPVVRSGSGSLPCAVVAARCAVGSPVPCRSRAGAAAFDPTFPGRIPAVHHHPRQSDGTRDSLSLAGPKTRDRTPKYAFGRDIYTIIYTRSDLRRDVKT